MTHRYILNLNWNTKNMAYMLLYSVFKHNLNNIKTKLTRANPLQKRGLLNTKIIRNRPKRIKNNQFNIKWFFNRYLKLYYQTAHLSHIETRLDILLFRTNWFLNQEAARIAIKSGLIQVNGVVLQGSSLTNGQIKLNPGDIIKVNTRGIANNLWLTSHFNENISKTPLSLKIWASEIKKKIIPNIPYLEINNNIKTLIILNKPKFNEIPYPFNLRKFQA